jgi:hypothetical protein
MAGDALSRSIVKAKDVGAFCGDTNLFGWNTCESIFSFSDRETGVMYEAKKMYY